MVFHRHHPRQNEESGLRLFVAIELNDAAKTRLVEVQQELTEQCKGVRWTSAEQLHLTVKFLGEVEEKRVEKVKSAIVSSAASVPGFTLKIGGCGCLPPKGVVRVLFAGAVDTTGRLMRCVQSVESAMDSVGFLKDEKPFLSHITIGRTKDGWSAENIRTAISSQTYSSVVLPVESITLMSSVQRPEGTVYEAVVRAPLGHG
ncbi:MAG: RNA 2',3'-cyclic phosphodiesterase [Planctomycetota bacterium]